MKENPPNSPPREPDLVLLTESNTKPSDFQGSFRTLLISTFTPTIAPKHKTDTQVNMAYRNVGFVILSYSVLM